MTERIEKMRAFLWARAHHRFRRTPESLGLDKLSARFAEERLPDVTRSARMLEALLRAEEPIILEGERIVATRTITRIPSVFTEAEWAEIKAAHTLHERGTVSNISADYEGILRDGLGARRKAIAARYQEVLPEGSLPSNGFHLCRLSGFQFTQFHLNSLFSLRRFPFICGSIFLL